MDILLVLLLGCDEMSGPSHLMFDICWTLVHFMTLDMRHLIMWSEVQPNIEGLCDNQLSTAAWTGLHCRAQKNVVAS